MSLPRQEREKIARSALARLGEVFDSVQILATWVDDDGTTLSFHVGEGDWYARVGNAMSWIERGVEQDRVEARNNCEGDEF